MLVVTAHPDDVDFGTAGTVAAFTRAGLEVTYCIATNGDAGGSDRAMSRADMAALRQGEQRAAAAEVGVTDVRFLGHPDGRLLPTIELRRDISRVIRQVRPERVLCPSPERRWDFIYASHPDHLAAGEAAVCAVYPDARNPFAHPELLADYVNNTSPVQVMDHGDDAVNADHGKVVAGRQGEAWYLDEFGGFGKVRLFSPPTARLARQYDTNPHRNRRRRA